MADPKLETTPRPAPVVKPDSLRPPRNPPAQKPVASADSAAAVPAMQPDSAKGAPVVPDSGKVRQSPDVASVKINIAQSIPVKAQLLGIYKPEIGKAGVSYLSAGNSLNIDFRPDNPNYPARTTQIPARIEKTTGGLKLSMGSPQQSLEMFIPDNSELSLHVWLNLKGRIDKSELHISYNDKRAGKGESVVRFEPVMPLPHPDSPKPVIVTFAGDVIALDSAGRLVKPATKKSVRLTETPVVEKR